MLIKIHRIALIFIIFLFYLMSCSAHSPMIIKNTIESQEVSINTYPTHTNKVLITSGSLPAASKYEIIALIEVGKVWYGSSKNVLSSMAERAREIGADAVIEVKTWRQPSGWSWAAPHGSGKAIKLLDASSVDFSSIEGEWY